MRDNPNPIITWRATFLAPRCPVLAGVTHERHALYSGSRSQYSHPFQVLLTLVSENARLMMSMIELDRVEYPKTV
ncbi:hypothetical protein CEXT_62371 [Caerostris extrusa]|uniref:Uncharacterized protein n=1 Tax=Caerostris extrusa TaxID=172846 RepID=A0AAV4XRE7_CAEEX|nr:hypothetical protein CEXT_62371 [Caerostris extrusa]